MNVVLVAEESAGVRVLRALAQSNHRLVAVLTSPTTSAHGVSVHDLAGNLGLRVWPASLVQERAFAERIRSEGVDILLNVHSLHLIHDAVLRAPGIGSFNVHPGPLPKYAGLNSVSWAIYRGEVMHGVTVHKMLTGIDTGPIVYKATFPIGPEDTGLSVFTACVKQGLQLVLRLLDVAATTPGDIPLIEQDLSAREYFGRQVPQGGNLFWSLPARRIVDFVRACDFAPFRSPWGHPLFRVGNQNVSAMKAALTGEHCNVEPGTVGRIDGTSVRIASADEWISLNKLMVNGRYADAADCLASAVRVADGRVEQSRKTVPAHHNSSGRRIDVKSRHSHQ